MKDECVIVLGMRCSVPVIDAEYIGADRGALYLAQQGIPMSTAIGDFDSVSDNEKELIRTMSGRMIVLNPIKDATDSEAAIRTAADEGYSRILVYGGLGGRMDHTLINLRLAAEYTGRLYLLDEHNEISVRETGIYCYCRDEYKYFSVLPLGDASISLSGMKYPLDHRRITMDDLYTTSNEITDAYGTLHVHSGKVIVIRSRD